MDCFRFLCAGLVALVGFFSVSVGNALEIENPLTLSCSEFRNGTDFARRMGLYCLGSDAGEKCHHQAESYFRSCGFDGKYSRLRERAHTQLVLVALLSNNWDFGLRKELKSSSKTRSESSRQREQRARDKKRIDV